MSQTLLLRAAAATLLLFCSGFAAASSVVLVSADTLSLRDRSDSSYREIDRARYALPQGFAAVGADFDPDDQRFYLLARNAQQGLCAVYFVDLENTPEGGLAPISTSIPTVPCSPMASELEFIPSSGRADAGLLVADGTVALSYNSAPDTPGAQPGWERIAVRGSSGCDARVLGFGFLDGDNLHLRRAIVGDGQGRVTLCDVEGDSAGITLGNPRALLRRQGNTSSDAQVRLPIAYDLIPEGGGLLMGASEILLIGGTSSTFVETDTPPGTVALAIARDRRRVVADDRVVQTGSGGSLRLTTSAGSFENLRADTQPSYAPDRTRYPYGWVAFRIRGLSPGQTVEVTLTPQGEGPPADRYIKCSPRRGVCEPFQGATFANGTATLRLTDGGAGDDDGTANGVVDDPGALALPADPAAPAPAPSPAPAPGPASNSPTYINPDPLRRAGAMGWLPLAVLLAAAGCRRRRIAGR